jgi:hypothetical protein
MEASKSKNLRIPEGESWLARRDIKFFVSGTLGLVGIVVS